jgi:hypothetical protein
VDGVSRNVTEVKPVCEPVPGGALGELESGSEELRTGVALDEILKLGHGVKIRRRPCVRRSPKL